MRIRIPQNGIIPRQFRNTVCGKFNSIEILDGKEA